MLFSQFQILNSRFRLLDSICHSLCNSLPQAYDLLHVISFFPKVADKSDQENVDEHPAHQP